MIYVILIILERHVAKQLRVQDSLIQRPGFDSRPRMCKNLGHVSHSMCASVYLAA